MELPPVPSQKNVPSLSAFLCLVVRLTKAAGVSDFRMFVLNVSHVASKHQSTLYIRGKHAPKSAATANVGLVHKFITRRCPIVSTTKGPSVVEVEVEVVEEVEVVDEEDFILFLGLLSFPSFFFPLPRHKAALVVLFSLGTASTIMPVRRMPWAECA